MRHIENILNEKIAKAEVHLRQSLEVNNYSDAATHKAALEAYKDALVIVRTCG